MKKVMYLFFLGIMGCIGFSACGSSADKEVPVPENDSVAYDSAALRIGYLPTLEALPLLVAEEEGLFDSLQTDIVLEAFTSNMDMDTAFINRRIHIAMSDVCRAILHNAQNPEIKIISRTDGTSYLVTQKQLRLRKTSDLPERMIGIARNEASDWMVDVLLEEEGMEPSMVNRPQINNIQLRQEMVQKEMIDAAILPEPYATQAAVWGDRLIWNSEQLPTGCMIIPQKVLVNRESELHRMAQAYNLASERINQAPKGRYDALMQKAYGIDVQVTDTLELPHYNGMSQPDMGVIDRATDWLKNRYDEADWLGFRILKKDYKPNELIDSRLSEKQ